MKRGWNWFTAVRVIAVCSIIFVIASLVTMATVLDLTTRTHDLSIRTSDAQHRLTNLATANHANLDAATQSLVILQQVTSKAAQNASTASLNAVITRVIKTLDCRTQQTVQHALNVLRPGAPLILTPACLKGTP